MERTPPLDIPSLLQNGFDETTARSLYAQGEEIVIFALLQLAALALTSPNINGEHPSTPSATVAVFQKENKQKGKRKKKPGGKPGHKGSRRPPPNITHKLDHRATHCPDCGTKLNKRKQTRTRLTEDIPANITPEVTEHTIHRDYCPHCKKIVEPAVPDAMPNATIGHRTVVLSAFLHYFVGTTISQIVEIFNTQFYFKLTPGGLIHLWHNLALVLMLWYEEIGCGSKKLGGTPC
jgi:transposase